MIIMRYNLW